MAQDSISTYIRAKDENRPYLMSRAFVDSATLEIVAKPGTISFPPTTIGLDSITDVLVRQFSQKFENIHTFCLAAPPQIDDKTFSCPWLVGMSEKETGDLRVGGGRYDWVFQSERPRLVERLTITIEVMQVLPPASLGTIMNWLSRLPYPWCPLQTAVNTAPTLDALTPVVRCIAVADSLPSLGRINESPTIAAMKSSAFLEPLRVYLEAFAEHDRARRRELLGRCMTSDAEIWGPKRVFAGYAEISDKIAAFHQNWPGCHLVLASGINTFGNVARFGGAIVDPGGSVVASGHAVIEMAQDGRICRVVPFWDALPPIPEFWPRHLAVSAQRDDPDAASPALPNPTRR